MLDHVLAITSKSLLLLKLAITLLLFYNIHYLSPLRLRIHVKKAVMD